MRCLALIPKFFFNAVVSIGSKINDEIKWIGTGFLVGRKEENLDSYTIFLITNLHIVEKKSLIFVRFNKKLSPEFVDCEIILNQNNKVQYSIHTTADIVAIQLSHAFLQNKNIEYNWFSLDKHALLANDMKNTDVIEGCLIYSLGYPISLIGSSKNFPICRLGCISRISELFDSKGGNEYLVDLQTIPGNSGSPIINRPENSYIQGTSNNDSANLIGIISGTIDYSEKCKDKKCEYGYEKNSGLTIVHTVDSIIEVVEMEYQRKKEV